MSSKNPETSTKRGLLLRLQDFATIGKNGLHNAESFIEQPAAGRSKATICISPTASLHLLVSCFTLECHLGGLRSTSF